MFKKMISVLLAVMMVVSVMAVSSFTYNAATLEANKIYFDTNGTGWDIADSDIVSFYVYSLTDGELAATNSKPTIITSLSSMLAAQAMKLTLCCLTRPAWVM